MKNRVFAERLRTLRQRLGLTQQELADQLGIHRATYGNYEAGNRDPDFDTLLQMAEFFGCSVDYLLGRESRDGMNTNLMYHDVEEMVKIPVLGFIKAGYDLYAEQQVIGYEVVAKRDVIDGEYFYLMVTGDSMINEGIREGMRVLVRKQNWVDEGKIAVVLINGDEATLKRVYYNPGNRTVTLVASNPKYPPVTLPIDEVLIQGQVKRVEWDV